MRYGYGAQPYMILRVTRMMREGERGGERSERGTVGLLLLLTVILLLLCLRKRHQSRPRQWRWRQRQQKLQNQLWSKKSPKRNVGRSRVRPRHAAARNRKPCKGNAHVPKYSIFRVLEYPLGALLVFYFHFLFILVFATTARSLSVLYCNSPTSGLRLYHGHTVFPCV